MKKASLTSADPLGKMEIMPGQKQRRPERCWKLIKWRKANPAKAIPRSDEKQFVTQHFINKRNDCYLVSNSKRNNGDCEACIMSRHKNRGGVRTVVRNGQVVDPIFLQP